MPGCCNRFYIFFIALLSALITAGCASSGATRVAASEADKVYIGTDQSLTHMNGDLRDTIQNTNQTVKGVVIGGLAGAVAGSLYSTIGVIPGLAGGAIIGGAIGAYVDAYASAEDRLENRGIQVIQLGDQIKFVLPSYFIFNPYSAVLRPSAYSTLDQITDLISQYPNESVKVAAFTSTCMPGSVSLAVSQQQADAIVKYMTKRGINTRLIYAGGYGGTQLVSPDLPDWSSDNYRVEITLEKLPV